MTEIITASETKDNLDDLMSLAEGATKIKLHEGYLRQSARFFGERVWTVPAIEPETYSAFVKQLECAGWQVAPGLENGAYIARKQTN